MEKIRVLYDGDMGGDDLWAMALMLGHPDRFDLIAVTTVFGNVSQPFATQNVMNFLHWLGRDDIPVIQGADMPIDGQRPFGDDAYGADGVGGILLPPSPQTAEYPSDIADWYAAQLDIQATPVTLFCTGPATNIARFLKKYPQKSGKIDQIIVMAGAIAPPGRGGKPFIMENGQVRIGNITPFAEFNAYQDPEALNILLKSGVKCVFASADANQNLVLTPERQAQVADLHPTYGPAFKTMMMAVEPLDRAKFGVNGPFIHDPNAVISMLRPDLYDGRAMPGLIFEERIPSDEKRGMAVDSGSGAANALWLSHLKDPESAFQLILDGLKRVIDGARSGRARLAG